MPRCAFLISLVYISEPLAGSYVPWVHHHCPTSINAMHQITTSFKAMHHCVARPFKAMHHVTTSFNPMHHVTTSFKATHHVTGHLMLYLHVRACGCACICACVFAPVKIWRQTGFVVGSTCSPFDFNTSIYDGEMQALPFHRLQTW